jgi:3-oxoacyl-(acyl-carrier-protein) synthase
VEGEPSLVRKPRNAVSNAGAVSHDDYAMVTSDAGAFDQAYAFTGNPFSMASGRIAHALGLTGPALTTDTACSSSMVAVHQACRSLHDGESDMALAGGVMLMLDQRLYASASGQGMLSATGHCHAFDVEADGFVRAEGCGIVMLKRLDDAQRDGDRVLAVIRGTASNQDGRTDNILTPSGAAQVEVFRAGKYKAPNIAGEGYTDEMRALEQKAVEAMHEEFKQTVLRKRSLARREDMEGQIFTGREAAAKNLVTGLATSFAEALAAFEQAA